jgi:hypothetical protein
MGNSENIQVFVLTCIIKIPWMSLMYTSYHQKFCISVQVAFVRGRVIQCTVCVRNQQGLYVLCVSSHATVVKNVRLEKHSTEGVR